MIETTGPLIFLVAGEPSGDALGAKLMRALKAQSGGSIRFAGVGGERMEAEGLTSLFPLHDIAVMGFTEIVPQLPTIFRRLRQTIAAVERMRPAALVTIDAPAFSLRVAKQVRRLGVPAIHFVAPQLWAWRPERVTKLAQAIDHLLLLFPFEAAFFERAGIACTYVGHPVLEDAADPVDADFRAVHGIANDAPLLLAMPGSRRGLAGRMLPVFQAAVGVLEKRHPALRVVVPIVAGTADLVSAHARAWTKPPILVQDMREKRAAFRAADAALTISGTATMELAVAGVPMVVAYRTTRLSAWLARRLIQVPFVAMPNLVAGRSLVPELLQEACTSERIAEEIDRLLTDQNARAAQKAGLADVCAKLGQDGPSPSTRAAAVVLDFANRKRAKS